MITPSLPGITGIPAAFITSLAFDLSLIRFITAVDGPINVIPCFSQTSTKCSFSERNPYPGKIASASVTSAAAIIAGIFR